MLSLFGKKKDDDIIDIVDISYARNDIEEIRRNIGYYSHYRVANEKNEFKDFLLTENEKNMVINSPSPILAILDNFFNKYDSQISNPSRAYLLKKNQRGGYKKTYLVKELKDIAKRNNIKITKKSNGKDVYLNKQELTTKLKKIKLI